jgi:hypothetical protein
MATQRRQGLSTASESELRQATVRFALDVARLPMSGPLHRRLDSCMRDFVACEGAMGLTAAALRSASEHANTLKLETQEWDALFHQAPELCQRLDEVVSVFTRKSEEPDENVAR